MQVKETSIAVSAELGTVSALIRRPRGARSLYVMAHGAGAGMRHRFLEEMSTALAENRVATLRYQFPYKEAGRKLPGTTPGLTDTVRAVIRRAPGLVRGLPIVAGGKSMGGRMTSSAQAADPMPRVRGLVFLGFPLHRPGRAGDERGDHLFDVTVPMLFVQGTRDPLAELPRVRRLCRRLGDTATLRIIKGADHGFDVLRRSGRTGAEVIDEIAGAVGEWIDGVIAR